MKKQRCNPNIFDGEEVDGVPHAVSSCKVVGLISFPEFKRRDQCLRVALPATKTPYLLVQ